MLSYCKLTAMLTLHMRDSSGTTWQQNFQTTCTTCRLFLLQAIRVESAGHVETAILHIVEAEASTAEMRGAAMHNRSAKHSFLFDQQGTLLHASKAALEAYDQGSGIWTVICCQLACLLAVLPNMLIASMSLVQHTHWKDSDAHQVCMKDSCGGIHTLFTQITYVVAAHKYLRLTASSTQHKHANNMQCRASHANFAATMQRLLR